MRSVERNLADRIGAAAISTEIGCEREMRPREPVQRRKSGREPVASALQLRIEAAPLEVTVQLEAKRRGARKLQPGKVPEALEVGHGSGRMAMQSACADVTLIRGLNGGRADLEPR